MILSPRQRLALSALAFAGSFRRPTRREVAWLALFVVPVLAIVALSAGAR